MQGDDKNDVFAHYEDKIVQRDDKKTTTLLITRAETPQTKKTPAVGGVSPYQYKY